MKKIIKHNANLPLSISPSWKPLSVSPLEGEKFMRGRGSSSGFTLIEMLVAVALFATVMTIAVGSLISIVGASRRSIAAQSVINNLNFAIDDMSRTIRNGTDYVFTPDSQQITATSSDGVKVMYKFASGVCTVGYLHGCIMKSVNNGDFLPITSPEISFDDNGAKFYLIGASPRSGNTCVSGTQPANTDCIQPKVTLILRAHVDYMGNPIANLNIETTMTQRRYDI